MNFLVFHIASGQAFFSGSIAILLSGLMVLTPYKRIARYSTVTALLGVVFVSLSSSPLPYWCYLLCAVVTIGWIAAQAVGKKQREWSFGLLGIWVLAIAIEFPYHWSHSLSPVELRSLTIIGDSVTAGSGDNEKFARWPQLFAERHGIEILDVSYVGETAASALKRIKSHKITSPIVLLEIGGNDLLGSTPSAQFEEDLNALLQHLSKEDRQLVMFELPLFPLANEFGRIQRKLSRKHGVTLIPKREFLHVIADGDATLDSIHLSESGHERMERTVWRMVGSAYPNNTRRDISQ